MVNMKSLLDITLKIALFLLLGVTILSLLGTLHNYFEILSNLRLLLALFSVIAACLSLLSSNKINMCMAALALFINVTPLASMYLPAEKSTASSDTHRLSVMQFNLWGGKNSQYAAVVKAIIEANPDIIMFSEISPTWLKALKAGLAGYPYVTAHPHNGGIAVFSRLPIAREKIEIYGPRLRPRAIVTITQAGSQFTFIAIHPHIPIKTFALRNGEFEVVAREARQAGENGPVIIAGDLNCTSWSPYFSKLLSESNLKNSESGFGVQPTYNRFHLFPLLPIDNCLVSKNINVISRTVGPAVGSDHLPVTVVLEIPNQR
jgi:endonuclease/exonuclease/phosphatase (EEP) superfamily protein YafD